MNTHAIKCTSYDKKYFRGQVNDYNKLSDYGKIIFK